MTNSGLVRRHLLCDSKYKGRKSLDEEARGDGTVSGVFPEVEIYQYVRPEQVTEATEKLATSGTTMRNKSGARFLGGYIESYQG